MALSVSKDISRLLSLFGRSGWHGRPLTSSSSHTRTQSWLESGKCGGSLNNAHPQTRQLHTTALCKGTPAIDSSVPLSPAVRYLVYTHNIADLSQITATGPGQRLLKGDILQYIEHTKDGKVSQSAKQAVSKPVEPVKPVSPKKSPKTTHSPTQVFTDFPVGSERVATAQRVVQHKASTPHTYSTTNCTLDRIFKLGYSEQDLMAIFVKVAALTIQKVPQSNCVWLGDDVRPLPSISVSVSSENGPVRVDRANELSFEAINKALNEGNSSTEEASSISVSHLSTGSVSHFTSVIDPTSTSTLSIGAPQLVPNEQGPPSRRVAATLTADARVIDYELSCHWLDTFRSIVEGPDTSGLL